jgi:hypothetical protein
VALKEYNNGHDSNNQQLKLIQFSAAFWKLNFVRLNERLILYIIFAEKYYSHEFPKNLLSLNVGVS